MVFLCCFVTIRHGMIGTRVVQFEINHVNPFVLCETVEGAMKGTLLAHALTVIVSLFAMKLAWPVFLAGILSLLWLVVVKRTQKRFFDPISIVRNTGKVKLRHGLIALVHLLIVFHGIAMIIVEANSTCAFI